MSWSLNRKALINPKWTVIGKKVFALINPRERAVIGMAALIKDKPSSFED